ncbi:hypothetical protein ACFPH6_14790, partial [Streptomyces xiangluensis]
LLADHGFTSRFSRVARRKKGQVKPLTWPFFCSQRLAPRWRQRVVADDKGRFAVTAIQPAPYQIPTDGSCGRLITAAGWHAWRPATSTQGCPPPDTRPHHAAVLQRR